MASGGKQHTNLGATVLELETASNDRLVDADLLFRSDRFAMAIAMGIYALEIRLKHKICRCLELDKLPRTLEFHDLEGLLIYSGLWTAMAQRASQPVKMNWNEIVQTAKDLNDLRYKPNQQKSRPEAEAFFSQLRDPNHGVLPWILNQP